MDDIEMHTNIIPAIVDTWGGYDLKNSSRFLPVLSGMPVSVTYTGTPKLPKSFNPCSRAITHIVLMRFQYACRFIFAEDRQHPSVAAWSKHGGMSKATSLLQIWPSVSLNS